MPAGGTVIKSFKHSGLEKSFLTGSKAGIRPAHANKLELSTIHAQSGDRTYTDTGCWMEIASVIRVS
jgi:hypothetical protein